MKVLIINTPLFRFKNMSYDEDSLPPIGLGYIATHLQNKKINVELWDTIGLKLSFNELKSKIEKTKPEFLAANIFTTNYEIVKELIESLQIKTHFVIGGLATKSLYEKIIKWKTSNQIDIVIGDGELITVDIIKNKITEKSLYSNHKRRVFTIASKSVYFLKSISNIPLNRDFFINEPVKTPMGYREVNIVSSRGCIYNCSFCAAARALNKDYAVRERSTSSIRDELSEIKVKYPEANSIRILDDLFLKSKASLTKAVEIFSNFDFQWRAMAHIRTFSNIEQEYIDALKNSGCRELFIGLESGSSRILDYINKTSNITMIIENLTKIFKAKINVKGYFIYGFPGETFEEIQMTYDLARKLKKLSNEYGSDFRTSVFQFRPYHGTEIYNNLKKTNPNIHHEQVSHNKELSKLIGRDQFNFHINNYSNVSLNTIHDYICKTNMI